MAIKAHLDPTAPGEGQRATPRRDLRLEASGMLPDGDEANVTVHNISATGLLLETGLDLATGEQLVLDLPEAGLVEAAIMWRSEQLYGCAFATPLGAGALAAAQLQGLPVAESKPSVDPAGVQAGVQPPVTGAGESLGSRLNRLRREAGLTLADVALRLGVSKPTVWAWEKGKARPLPERIDAIAEALGVAPEQLVETVGSSADIGMLIEDCRQRIAEACNTTPHAVRIMIEL
ncbi:helix-turn-helix domain-containing protein [Erythrobacter sp.]|uniref:helix-turn-helix domain-containing protein n=1 Tax=Erythrobacter sp. TaxID=1042 RepID=UPI0025F7DCFB|nr:helix-turn-helix domain-containing protein [Erythrobacter sp.]